MMNKVILDDAVQAKFNLQANYTEVCSTSGQAIGYFLSPEFFKKLMYAWLKEQVSDEEAERAWNDYLRNGGVSTEEAWRRVKARCNTGESAA
jgi:hypothetical protein